MTEKNKADFFLHFFSHSYCLTRWLTLLVAITASHTVFALSAHPHAAANQKSFSATAQTVFRLDQVNSLKGILTQEIDARVFLVGETHTRFDHHQVQLETLKFLHEKDIEIALGVEWFQQPSQQYLDSFVAGQISEKEMLHKTAYFDLWSYDYRLYRPILLYAREHGIPIIALNASRELTDALSKHGFDNLPKELKAQLPKNYDWSDQAYEQRLNKVFKMHPEFPGTFNDFLRTQLTWDESMAERAADYLKANPASRMLILAGTGHIQFGSGIPNRIKRRISGKAVSILSSDDHTTITPGIADYLVLTTEYKLQPTGLIGAFLKMSGEFLVVMGFSHNSASKDAGLKEGAVIVGVDDTKVASFTDFKLAMLDKKPGDTIELHYVDSPAENRAKWKTVKITLR